MVPKPPAGGTGRFVCDHDVAECVEASLGELHPGVRATCYSILGLFIGAEVDRAGRAGACAPHLDPETIATDAGEDDD
jgi:hypothetical protein